MPKPPPSCPRPTAKFVAYRKQLVAPVAADKVVKPASNDSCFKSCCAGFPADLPPSGPFWALEAEFAYGSFPSKYKDPNDPAWENKKTRLWYNGVDFWDARSVARTDDGAKYWQTGHSAVGGKTGPEGGLGRFYLHGGLNAHSCAVKEGFAEEHSFVLGLAGDALTSASDLGGAYSDVALKKWSVEGQDFQVYAKILEVYEAMFPKGSGWDDDESPRKVGIDDRLHEAWKQVPDANQITIVGHGIGGAYAQLAAVEIALKYKDRGLKVRLITYDGTLAFDGASARWVHDHLVAVEDSTAFPADAGKITSLRWVHDQSAVSVAPLIPRGCSFWCGAGLGAGFISKALVMSGPTSQKGPASHDAEAKVSPSKPGDGPPLRDRQFLCFSCCGKEKEKYPPGDFVFKVKERTYVTSAARRLRCCGCCGCCAGAGLVNHLHPFLLWTLYKGAWQSTNQDTTLKPLVCSG